MVFPTLLVGHRDSELFQKMKKERPLEKINKVILATPSAGPASWLLSRGLPSTAGCTA